MAVCTPQCPPGLRRDVYSLLEFQLQAPLAEVSVGSGRSSSVQSGTATWSGAPVTVFTIPYGTCSASC